MVLGAHQRRAEDSHAGTCLFVAALRSAKTSSTEQRSIIVQAIRPARKLPVFLAGRRSHRNRQRVHARHERQTRFPNGCCGSKTTAKSRMSADPRPRRYRPEGCGDGASLIEGIGHTGSSPRRVGRRQYEPGSIAAKSYIRDRLVLRPDGRSFF